MEILNSFEEIKDIVEEKAKYQKVMLIYDDETSETDLLSIYEQVREICVFNKLKLGQDLEEIYNGYKLLIFVMSSNSFLKFDYDIEEFVSIFVSKDEMVLPFYLDHSNRISASERYLLSTNQILDLCAISSVKFNKFYSYLNELVNFNFSQAKLDYFDSFSDNYLDLNSIDKDVNFYDIEILKKTGLSYNKIILVDFIILCGFICVINAISNSTLQLVDCYKSLKEDTALIDKFYALQVNNSFIKIVELNINFLTASCNRTKSEILNLIHDVDHTEIDNILTEIKSFSKQEDTLLNYLYLYNVFGY